MRHKLLDNIKVLDFGQVVAAPLAVSMLADIGADVIKIEPLQGDMLRLTSRPELDSVTFLSVNRSKRSLAVNLTEPEGKRIVMELVRTADVIVHNFRLGVMEKLRFDYKTVSRVNQHIVFCSTHMYGESGPLAHRRGGDIRGLKR